MTFLNIDGAYAKADQLKSMIHARTGLEPRELRCPREKTFMTPCIARDGQTAVTVGGLCVGCERSVESLHTEETARIATDAGSA